MNSLFAILSSQFKSEADGYSMNFFKEALFEKPIEDIESTMAH